MTAEENTMKISYVFAAIAVAAISLPTLASAETTIIRKNVYRDGGPRAEMRMHRDRGYHRGMHRGGDRVVIIKKSRHHRWD
jgi:hypothetical protein